MTEPNLGTTDPILGEIRLVGFNFAPAGWIMCDGRLLNIRDNMALYSLFGTIYGGDGHTTFGIPNLNGNVPIGSTSMVGEKGTILIPQSAPVSNITIPTQCISFTLKNATII